ncbi:MAG TPA: FkbM family methyltransferase [Bacteroidales bacterium]|nr:FkbM family methyltransferase [Bacteroidales bacterium]
MKKSVLSEFAKILIDSAFRPVRKNKTILSHLFNNTFRKELEERIENGGIFPMHHIHRSIRLAKMLPQQDFLIVDIGGGIGASVILYRKYFPENHIIAFEPITENYNAIKSRIKDLENIEVVNKALGNENSFIPMNIANRITSSSLLPLSADPGSEAFSEKNLGKSRDENIEVVRLDDFLLTNPRDIGIMKIDVQGYEMNVLKGAEKTLERTKVIVLEANNHEGYSGAPKYYETDEFLRNHNFTLYDILPSIFEKGKLKEWDVIYLNKSAECTLA